MSRASSLYRLQELNLALDHSRERVEEIEVILEDDEEIVLSRGILKEAEAQLKAARTANSHAEHVVASQRDKIERTEKTLYGGTIRNPKELQERQQEAESLKRYLVTLEDRLFEAMINLEDAQRDRDAASEKLVRVQEAQAIVHMDLGQERDQLLMNITRLEDEREAALENIEQQDLGLYMDLRKKFSNIAIALVQEGSCSACGLGLSHSMQQSIRHSTDLIRCDQCGRILYAG